MLRVSRLKEPRNRLWYIAVEREHRPRRPALAMLLLRPPVVRDIARAVSREIEAVFSRRSDNHFNKLEAALSKRGIAMDFTEGEKPSEALREEGRLSVPTGGQHAPGALSGGAEMSEIAKLRKRVFLCAVCADAKPGCLISVLRVGVDGIPIPMLGCLRCHEASRVLALGVVSRTRDGKNDEKRAVHGGQCTSEENCQQPTELLPIMSAAGAEVSEAAPPFFSPSSLHSKNLICGDLDNV